MASNVASANPQIERLQLGNHLNWRYIAISNNVGSVKRFSSELLHALEKERHFARVDCLRFPTWARF